MSIGDYLEHAESDKLQQAKDEFVDFIVSLEGTLDEAEEYGKERDLRMLDLLKELDTVDEDIEYYAKRANDPIPMRDYHVEISKLIHNYLLGILNKELDITEKFLQENPDDTEEAVKGLNEIGRLISFYSDLYPDLNLESARARLLEINSKFQEIEE
ncbi:MAG: hypothetical protein KA052_00625 [Candidatus Pacebacteria bacterium]|nr:hypothetical protein [Candidatus Paceibacterota bacterium]